MKRKEINTLKKIVHQVGFIYKFLLVLPECLEEECYILFEYTLCFLLQFLDYTFKLSTEWHFFFFFKFFQLETGGGEDNSSYDFLTPLSLCHTLCTMD